MSVDWIAFLSVAALLGGLTVARWRLGRRKKRQAPPRYITIITRRD